MNSNSTSVFIKNEEFVILHDVQSSLFEYLSKPINIEKINEISRILNGCDYFDVVPHEIAGSDGLINFKVLMSHMNKNLIQFRHLNLKKISFYPILHFNGSERVDLSKHELIVHKLIFDDIVHPSFPVCNELFILVRRRRLKIEMNNIYILGKDDSVFDTICCRIENRNQSLHRHEFDPIYDEIILEIKTANAMNIYECLKLHLNKALGYFYSDTCFRRKLICSRINERSLFQEILRLISNQPIQVLVDNTDKSIMNYFMQIHPNSSMIQLGTLYARLYSTHSGDVYFDFLGHRYFLTREMIHDHKFI